jgi:hypothetical protein
MKIKEQQSNRAELNCSDIGVTATHSKRDTELGNGNMAFESGEQADLFLQLSNSESTPLTNTFTILQSLSPEIVVNDNYDDFGNIPVGGLSWGTGGYELIEPASTPEDQAYPMKLTIFADGGYMNTVEFSIPVGCGIDCDIKNIIVVRLLIVFKTCKCRKLSAAPISLEHRIRRQVDRSQSLNNASP